MTQLDDAHFELHSANKAKMKNMNDFFDNTNKVMIVDGDLIVYKIASGLEEPIDWGDDVWTLHCDLDKCKQFWKQAIAYYMTLTNSAMCIIAFSDVANYRKQLDLEYISTFLLII